MTDDLHVPENGRDASSAAGSTACDCIACRGELRDPPVRSAAASRRFPAREDGLFGGCPIYGEARSTGECEKCGGDLLACPVYGDGERKRQAEDRAAAASRVARTPEAIAKACPRDIARFCTPEAVEEVLTVWQEVIAELAPKPSDAAASSNATGPNASLRVYGSGRLSTSVPNAATVRFV